MITSELRNEIIQKRRQLDREHGEAKSLALRGKKLQTEIVELKERAVVLEKVASLLNTIGEDRQNQIQRTIENLVTLGLRTIFGPELSFHLVQKVSANKVQVDFVIRSAYDDKIIETPVMEARGGGLSATVGFLLRLVILVLTKPKYPFLVLDETFSHLSEDYLPAMASFLKEITEKMNVQIILVTHQETLAEAADICYRFSLDNSGRTIVKRQA